MLVVRWFSLKLEVSGLSKIFGEKKILDDIDFSFESGKIYGLIGRNGAGKTTFFNSINRDIDIDSGKFYLDDEFGKSELSTSDIGYVVSTPIVPEFLTAREFLSFFMEINKDKIDKDKTIDDYFELVQISREDQDKLLKDYSHGMKNKMQILINIIAHPKVILLDEPLTSLDVVVQDEMKKLLRSLKNDHIIIFSTHILEIAMDLCEEIVILNNKKLELVQQSNLNHQKYKDKIIKMLKDNKDD